MWNASEMAQERGDSNTLRQGRMAAHLLGCSLREGLDNVRRSWKRLKRRLAEAASCHMEDMYLSHVIFRRVPLPQTWSTTFVIPGCAIDQSYIDVEDVDPNLMVAALICYPDAGRVVGIVKAPCIRICHSFSDSRGLMNPHTSAHSPGISPGLHNGGEPRGIGKHVLAKASSIVPMGRWSLPDWRRHAARIEVIRHHVNLFLKALQYGLLLKRFLPMPRFLANWLMLWRDIMVK